MVQKNHILLWLLKVRLVVNGTTIYPLPRNKPVVVSIPSNPSKIVVTDGFHITRPLEVSCSHRHIYYFKIVCGIENDQLIIGSLIVFLIFMMGATSGLLFLQLLSILPVLYFLYLYYVKRKEFIRIKQY